MLSLLWWLPLAVAALAAIPLWRAGRRLQVESARIRTSAEELRRLRPLVEQVQTEVSGITAAAALDDARILRDLASR